MKSIKEAKLPELNDEFAAKAGPFKTVAELKADVKRELTDQKERESVEKLKDELVKELIGISKVPVPAILIEDQVRSIQQDFEQNLAYRGISVDQYLTSQKFADKDAWIEKEVKPTAEKRVKAGLILAELSRVEAVTATEDEITAHVDLYKSQYGNNKEALAQFDNPEVRRDIANRLLTEKTVEKLLELNKA